MRHRSLHGYVINSWNLEITHVFLLLKRLFFWIHSLKWQFHIRQQPCLRSGGCLLYSSGRLDYFSDWIPALCFDTFQNTPGPFLHETEIHSFFSSGGKKSFACYGCFGKNRLLIILFIFIISFAYAWVVKDSSVKTWCSDLNNGNTIKIS